MIRTFAEVVNMESQYKVLSKLRLLLLTRPLSNLTLSNRIL